MKKIFCFLLICMMLLGIIPIRFIGNVEAIGQHEPSNGTVNGSIESEVSATRIFYIDNDVTISNEYPDDVLSESYNIKPYRYHPHNKTLRGLISTDFSALPTNITIISATLKMYCDYLWSDEYVYVRRLEESFNENTATWNTQPAYNSSDLDSVYISNTGWESFDVTDDVRSVYNGTLTHYGWTLRVRENVFYERYTFLDKETSGTTYDPRVEVIYERQFNVTRTVSSNSESQNFSFTSSASHSGNVTFKIPVSTEVQGVFNVTNNTDNVQAIQVNTSDELVNNTFWYDSANQFVYIRTVNLTTSSTVNWTVNCSYGTDFNLIIPTYLTVGQYFHSEGFISDNNGNAITGMIIETRLLYANGTDALPVNPKYNCTDGNYRCTFSTSILLPGIYSVSIEFTDPTSGILFKYGDTLYLSFETPLGVYSDAVIYFSFYNTNLGLGLIPETFKLYIDGSRLYSNEYYGYTGQTINITIKDYYDFDMYSNNYTIVGTYTGLNFGLTFHEYDFTNENDEYYYASFLKDGADRWFEKVVSSSGGQKSFMLPSGNYTVRVYNADNSSYTSWTETINRSKAYLIGIDGVTLIIQGQSVIIGQFLELDREIDNALMSDVNIMCRNPPIVISAFDRIGMMLGGDYIRICPPLNVIAQTRETTTGNWINSTPLIPSNGSTENGTITILEDIIYFNIVNGTVPTWINITYTNNETVIQNTTYVPSKFYPFGYNVTINASTDINIQREVRFNQLKKFDWDAYTGINNPGWITESNGQKRTGYHRAGFEVDNTMSTIWYDVYVYAGFAPDSNPDLSTVRVRDVDNNNVILEEGEDYKSSSGIEFKITGSVNASETRNFLAEYYSSYDDQYYYGSDIVNVNAYQINKRIDEKLYNYFEYTWINSYDKTYRGSLTFFFDFEVATGIKQDDVIVYDAGLEQNITDFVVSDQFLQIGSNAIGDVSPGGGKTYKVYFKFETYPGQNPQDMHLDTPIFNGISLYIIFVFIGLSLMIFGILLVASKDKKKIYKDYGKGIVGIGLLIAVVVWVLSALGV